MHLNTSRRGRLAVTLTAIATLAVVAYAPNPAFAIDAPPIPSDATSLSTPAVDDEFGDYIFARSQFNTLIYSGARGSSISDLPPFVNLGGVVLSDPTAVTTALGPRAFVRGEDNQVYTILVRDFTTPTGFELIPGVRASSEVASVAIPRPDGGDVDIRIFVRNNGANISTNLLTASGWTGWSTVPGTGCCVASEISAELGTFAGLPGQSIRILFRAQEFGVRNIRTGLMGLDGTVTPFQIFGPVNTVGNVAFVPETDEFFTRASNGHVVGRNLATGVSFDLGGVGTSDVSASMLADGSVELVVRGQDGALYVNRRLPGQSFAGYQRIGGVATANPVSPGIGLQLNDIVVRGTNGVLYANPQAFDGSFLGYRSFNGFPHA